jgi:hypothetical protein
MQPAACDSVKTECRGQVVFAAACVYAFMLCNSVVLAVVLTSRFTQPKKKKKTGDMEKQLFL